MGIKNEDDNKSPRKPFIYYYLIVMIVMILFNALMVPWIQSRTIIEVPYSTFLEKVEAGQVTDVAKTDSEIQFIADTGEKDKNGKEIYATYKTGPWPDEKLTERLMAHKEINFQEAIVEPMNPLLSFFLTWILPILIFVFLGNMMAKQMQKRMGGGNAMTFGKSNAKIYAESETGKTFADVAGQEEAKDALKEIVDFLHNPQKYADIGASLPKGALLVGPPGTGKTLLARAVARDNRMGGNDEREQTLNQLLAEMDGFDGKKGVVILAATNRPDSLDKALLRPGRFDRRIPVELPDLGGREAILKVHGKNVKLSDDVNFHDVALATAGASGAELANIVNEAALRAVRMGRKLVSQEDLEESVEVVIAGYQKKDSGVSVNERKIIAYHEVGHALVAACQSHSAPVHKITIIPR